MTEDPISAKAAAREFGTDARTFRKFLRSGDSGVNAVGQGKRYEFTRKQVQELRERFDRWQQRARIAEVEE